MSMAPIVIYRTPKDWEAWKIEFRKHANASDVWKYIDPKSTTPWPTEPIEPDISTYPKRLIHCETRRTPSASTSSVSSTADMITAGIHQPDEVDPSSTPATITEMTTEGRAAYR